MTPTLLVILIALLVYAIAVAAVATNQERRVFQPRPGLAGTPRTIGLEYEDVALDASDGVRLHAWMLPAPAWAENPDSVLYLHGAGVNLGDTLATLAYWHGRGFAILALDYRGYGRSAGHPSEAGIYRDARAAWDHLVTMRRVRPGRIIVVAVSLGVSVATELATHVTPLALVLEAGFTRVADVAVRRYPWLPARQLTRIGLAAEDRVTRIRCPKLFVHSLEDRTVPITLGRKLFDRAAPPKKLLRILGRHARACEDGGHRYEEGLTAFLTSLPHDDDVA